MTGWLDQLITCNQLTPSPEIPYHAASAGEMRFTTSCHGDNLPRCTTTANKIEINSETAPAGLTFLFSCLFSPFPIPDLYGVLRTARACFSAPWLLCSRFRRSWFARRCQQLGELPVLINSLRLMACPDICRTLSPCGPGNPDDWSLPSIEIMRCVQRNSMVRCRPGPIVSSFDDMQMPIALSMSSVLG